MTKTFITFFAIILHTTLFGQFVYNDYSIQADDITIARTKTGSVFMELIKDNQVTNKYWMPASTNIAMQNALIKAKKWAKLNQTEMQEFKKDVVWIRVMDKEDYLSFNSYISEFSKECKLIFYGNSDGTFKCRILFVNDTIDYTISTLDDLDEMVSILRGKPTNKIDKIFN